jgi:Mlc titration factor MtfA (ptsG expression regulator)
MLSRSSAWRRARRGRQPLPPERRAILESRLAYYACLPEVEQAELRALLQVLLGEWSFEAGAGLDAITEEMRVLVAGQAALALLGRPLAELPRLRAVILYPGDYRAQEERLTPEGTWLRSTEVRVGEAWDHGVMVLSWGEAEHDAAHPGDGRCVAVHETAHALDAQTGAMNGLPPQPSAQVAEAWRETLGAARRQAQRDRRLGRGGLFDGDDLESPEEFFAASLEAFLEAPNVLAKGFPDLYARLSEYLRLDPRRWSARLDEATPS